MTSDELEPVEAHRRRILDALRPLPVVRLPLRDAAGLVLAEPLESRFELPRFDDSAMDGYAVRHADVASATESAPVALRVVAEVAAGSPLDPSIGPGEAVSIMTGAPLPSDADTVVRLEHTDGGTERVTVTIAPAPGAHVRRRGEQLAAGAPLLSAGVRLGPRQLAAAAAAGHSELPVRRAPRVAVVSTGTELRPPGSPLARGEIPESNSLLLAGLAGEAGAEIVHAGRVPDDPAALAAELDGCLAARVDLVVLSGGVSVGAHDVVRRTLAPLGTVGFHRVAMQPGTPQAFGTIGEGTPVFGLPGNPGAVAASFEMFVRPALLRLQGAARLHRPLVDAVVTEAWRTPRDRTQLAPIVFLRPGDGAPLDEGAGLAARAAGAAPRVRPVNPKGAASNATSDLAAAEGYAVVPPGAGPLRIGDIVPVFRVGP